MEERLQNILNQIEILEIMMIQRSARWEELNQKLASIDNKIEVALSGINHLVYLIEEARSAADKPILFEINRVSDGDTL